MDEFLSWYTIQGWSNIAGNNANAKVVSQHELWDINYVKAYSQQLLKQLNDKYKITQLMKRKDHPLTLEFWISESSGEPTKKEVIVFFEKHKKLKGTSGFNLVFSLIVGTTPRHLALEFKSAHYPCIYSDYELTAFIDLLKQ